MAVFTPYIEFLEAKGIYASQLLNLPVRSTGARPIGADLFTGTIALNDSTGIIEWFDGVSWISPIASTDNGFVRNQLTLQTPANFNISGSGQLTSLGINLAPSSTIGASIKAPAGSTIPALFSSDASFTGTSLIISALAFSGAERAAGITYQQSGTNKWFVGVDSTTVGLIPDFVLRKLPVTGPNQFRIQGNSGNVFIQSISTSNTPPATTGTSRMVIVDAAGMLSFAAGAVPTQYTDEMAQDAVGGILDASEFTYNDTAPLITINGISASKITTSTSRRFITDAQLLDFQDAFNNKIVSGAFSGTTTKTLTLTQQDGGTITASFLDEGVGGSSIATVKFHVGDVGAPANNATTYTNSSLINKTIFVYRENERMYPGDTSLGIDFDNTTGQITFYPSLDTGERVVIDVVDSLGTVPNVKNNIAFTTSIPFDYLITTIATHTVTAPLTFVKVTSGAEYGNGAMLRLVADGTNFPDFSDFKKLGNIDYDNTAGVINLIVFMYWGIEYTVSFAQPVDITGVTQLSTPGSFAVNAISGSAIDATWTDVPNETNYELQRGLLADYSDATTIASPAANAVIYHDTGLTPSTHYYYRLRAIGDGVTWLNSNWATANDTTDALPQLSTPTLTSTAVSGTQINNSWTSVTSATNYVLDRATNAGFTTGVALGIYSGSGLSYNNTGLANSTHYYYRVRAQASGFTDSLYGTDDDTTTSGSMTVATAPWYMYRKVESAASAHQVMYDSTHVERLRDYPHFTGANTNWDISASNLPATHSPLLVTSGIDGNPAVRFGPSGKQMYNQVQTLVDHPLRLCGMIRIEATAPSANQYFFFGNSGTACVILFYYVVTNSFCVSFNGSIINTTVTPAANTTYWFDIETDASLVRNIRINNVHVVTNFSDTGATQFTGEFFTNAGDAGVDWLYSEGGVFLVHASVPSAAVPTTSQMTEIYNDLKTRYASLP